MSRQITEKPHVSYSFSPSAAGVVFPPLRQPALHSSACSRSRTGHVRKGERGTPVCFWKWIDRTEDEASGDEPEDEHSEQRIPLLRYYVVFNAQQCRGIDRRLPPPRTTTVEPIATAEAIVAEMPSPPRLQHRSMQAAYHPALDLVTIPALEDFEDAEAYHSTLFHELAHSTGHPSRLNRPTITDACPFGTTNYSKEELTAEMAAAFLCGHAGIENRTIDSSTAYIANWYGRLQQDPKLLVHSAAAAQKAADYVLGCTATEGPEGGDTTSSPMTCPSQTHHN